MSATEAPGRDPRALRKLLEMRKCRTREEWEQKQAELSKIDAELRVNRADGRFRDRPRRAKAAEALNIVAHYRQKGLRAKCLRDAIERHARLVAREDAELADLLLDTPLVAVEPNAENQRRAAAAKARRL